MHKPIAAARSRGLRDSNDSLARQLLAAFPELDWPAARSLGTKIGEIDRGLNKWWLQRPELSRALAQQLDLPLADLGLETHKAGTLLHFAEFPELPPLALGSEAACPIGTIVDRKHAEVEILNTWMSGYPGGYVRNPSAGVSWVEVESGTGASFLAACLQANGRFEFRRAETLAELAPRLQQPQPLAIHLNQPLSQQDLIALAGIHQDTPLLIITGHPAPTSQPQASELYTSWAFHQATRIERRQMLLTHPRAIFNSLQRLRWRLVDDWQDLLLNWVEARLRAHGVDSLFTAQGLKRWLQRFTEVQRTLDTPRDLLGLCRFCHHLPETQLPKPEDTQAGAKLLKHLLQANAPQTALASTLIERHFHDRSRAWGQPLSLLDWATLAPGQAALPDLAELEAIADAGSAAARKQAVQALEKQLQGRRVEGLIDCGLLSATHDGLYRLQPPFLANLIARDQMLETARKHSATDWALLCFDAERQPIVDAALAQLSLGQLLPMAHTLAQLPGNDPRAIGLAETLFLTLGARLGKGSPLPTALRSIGWSVSARLDATHGEPLSRQLNSPQQQVQWQAACWAWSLVIPPAPNHSEALAWLFPGWCKVLDEHSPWCLNMQPRSASDYEPTLDAQWTRMLEVAGHWVASITVPPGFTPAFCRPLMLREAALGTWPIEDKWWHEVIDRPWAIRHLKTRLSSADDAQWPAVLLPSALRYCQQQLSSKDSALALMKVFADGPLQWLFSSIKVEHFLPCLREAEMAFLLHYPQSLPPILRQQLLQAPVIIQHLTPENQVAITQTLDDIDTLVQVLDTLPDAAQKLWDLAPQTAEQILRTPQSFCVTRATLQRLVQLCPPANTGAAIEYLLHQPQTDEQQWLHWLTTRLQATGVPSDALMDLFHQLQAAQTARG